VRDLSESAKDDPEFMADLAELEQTLLANQRLPPLSFEERVRSKFVKAARYAFSCFTGTKVQMQTQKARRFAGVQKYKY
jgi:hypothetical protein